MNEISTETFMIIFKPVLLYVLVGSIFFVFGIKSLITHRLFIAGTFGYLFASMIIYIGLLNMEIALINQGIVDKRIYISELMSIFYFVLLLYILSKTIVRQ